MTGQGQVSGKPADIPQDVWDTTLGWAEFYIALPDEYGVEITVARAILAERERCAKIADDREAICADAVAKIEAGTLYANISTARATEDCARMEASHIARLIRGEAVQ